MGVDTQANIEDVLESFGQFNTQVERELADECRKVRADLAASRKRIAELEKALASREAALREIEAMGSEAERAEASASIASISAISTSCCPWQ